MALTIYEYHTHSKGNVLPVNMWLAKDSSYSLPGHIQAKVEEKAKYCLNTISVVHVIYGFLVAICNGWKVFMENTTSILSVGHAMRLGVKGGGCSSMYVSWCRVLPGLKNS